MFPCTIHPGNGNMAIKNIALSSGRCTWRGCRRDSTCDSINRSVNGGNVLFFVREYKKEGASPFTCLGFADFQSHYGSAPISIVWKMKEPMPGFVMRKTVKI